MKSGNGTGKTRAKGRPHGPAVTGPVHGAGTGRVRDDHAVVERRLERFPFTSLDDRAEKRQLELMLDMAGPDGQVWIVEPPPTPGSRVPGPFAADTYIAIGNLYNRQIPLEERKQRATVVTRLDELASIMGRTRGGTTYTAIRRELDALLKTTITIARRGEQRNQGRRFQVLGEIEWDAPNRGDQGSTSLQITLHPRLAGEIANGAFRTVNTRRYFRLATPTSRRLYRYLDVMRWRGKTSLDELLLPLRQIAAELPIDRAAPSHIRRTLEPAHEALVSDGYLASATFEELPVAGKRRGIWHVRYRFAAALPLLPDHTEDEAAVGEATAALGALGVSLESFRALTLRQKVDAAQRACGDFDNVGLYTMCCKLLDDESLHRILATLRADQPANPRAAFVVAVKQEAKRQGLPLPSDLTDAKKLKTLL